MNQLLGCIYTVLFACAVWLFVLCSVLFIECMVALLPIPRINTYYRQDIKDVEFTVLIPAHNEEVVIGSTLENLKLKLNSLHRVVVVADNCTDNTAEIARTAGATVIERHEPNLRGKGYALDYGLCFLESHPPDVVVFLDADCQVSENAIEQLIQKAITTGRPVQATYLMAQPSNSTAKQSVSAFAFRVKNQVRLLGLAKLGMPCLLTGTGMAFPFAVIRSVNLASGSIVEDMKLGIDLSIAGYPPLFCPQAQIEGILPQQTKAVKSQRKRWEHGHLNTLLTYVPTLFKESVQQKRFDLLVSAIDLCVPPLSLFVLIWFSALVFSLISAIFTATWLPLITIIAGGCLFFASVIAAWTKFGRTDLPLLELLAIPFYIMKKIPIYFQFLAQPQNTWIRTERDSINM
ncbi:glycosyltransferase family 2 protein [Rivularia sp. UHCC 0363]|uniref:glycosyltransferase family 2 protein n=1 Tax=Rivularia sp. UHCC 0363 TaxID=3110244 RepID=UPI002B1F9E7C|nr:glycosyltransferase family 2 protein [Rivularia sp. UHCC 0363]MEA5595381.1 glycosyltransferase family 2 protein [Rivularia sp. UHCC 0363]